MNLLHGINWFFFKDKRVYIDRQGCRRVQVAHSVVEEMKIPMFGELIQMIYIYMQ